MAPRMVTGLKTNGSAYSTGTEEGGHVLMIDGTAGVCIKFNTTKGTLSVLTAEGDGLNITGIKGPIEIDAHAS